MKIYEISGDLIFETGGANLCGADLSGAYLRGAELCGTDLRAANLRGTDLRAANLENANLENANLRGAYLRGANLENANLCGADLSGAYLRGANLCGARNYYSFYAFDTSKRLVHCVKHRDTWMVKEGCFWGSLDELKAKVLKTHKSVVYLANIEILKQI